MKKRIEIIRRWYATGPMLITLAVALIPGAYFAKSRFSAEVQTPQTTIQQWPPSSRDVAQAMIEKYGAPDIFSEAVMVWRDNGTRARIVAYRDAAPSSQGTQ